jgi:(R,R)-butanediol dehydrogenase / meso-butanediol dehydrogenase / diacetyl reductase
MTLAARYLSARTLDTARAHSAPPGSGEVELAPAYVGICGTDLHIFHGDMDARVSTPAVLGHEMAGRVVRCGPDVTDWRPGDAVTVMPLRWDGTCPACRNGHQHICQHLDFIGIDSPGAMQQRWTVPASTLIRLPDSLPLDRAALVEPTAVAVHDVGRAGVREGERTVVVGGGPVGVLIALVADGTIPADRLISKVVPLTQAPAAFEALEGGADVMKVLVDCTDRAQEAAV